MSLDAKSAQLMSYLSNQSAMQELAGTKQGRAQLLQWRQAMRTQQASHLSALQTCNSAIDLINAALGEVEA